MFEYKSLETVGLAWCIPLCSRSNEQRSLSLCSCALADKSQSAQILDRYNDIEPGRPVTAQSRTSAFSEAPTRPHVLAEELARRDDLPLRRPACRSTTKEMEVLH